MLKNLFKKNVPVELDKLSVEELENLLKVKKCSEKEKIMDAIKVKFPKDFIENARKTLDSQIEKITLSDGSLELSFYVSIYTLYDSKTDKLKVKYNNSYIEKAESNYSLLNKFIDVYFKDKMIDRDVFGFVFNNDTLKNAVEKRQKLVCELEESVKSWSTLANVNEDIVWDIIQND